LHNGFRFPVQALPVGWGESIGRQNAAEPFYRKGPGQSDLPTTLLETGNQKLTTDFEAYANSGFVSDKKLLFHLCEVSVVFFFTTETPQTQRPERETSLFHL
jgi:hypothetical protein